MKISEILQSNLSRAINSSKPQDVVPQDVVVSNTTATMTSGIAEGISRVLRRVRGKGLKQGFRCTSGPRKGRVVARSSTCNARLNPGKGAKIRQKRQRVARQTAMKRSRTMRSGGASQRLKGIQIGKTLGKNRNTSAMKKSSRLQKSKIIKPKKK